MRLRADPALLECKRESVRILTIESSAESSPEPSELSLVEGVRERDVLGRSVLVVETHGDLGLGGKGLNTEKVDLVGGLDLVVIGGVLEVELFEVQGSATSRGREVLEAHRKHALLLQVGLVDTGERTGDDGL